MTSSFLFIVSYVVTNSHLWRRRDTAQHLTYVKLSCDVGVNWSLAFNANVAVKDEEWNDNLVKLLICLYCFVELKL